MGITILAFVIGLIIGLIFAYGRNKPVGTLRIDRSDPYDSPYLFLEKLTEDPRDLANKKYVVLKVNPQNYISQK